MTTTTPRPTHRRGVAHDPGPGIGWMTEGTCVTRDDLPWIADPEHATAWDRLTMAGLCRDCPVLSACAGYASREKVTAGFWAGSHRDPDLSRRFAGPGWAAETLPGLAGLGDLGGAA